MAEPRRISQTVVKLPAVAVERTHGFRAELPNWDLPTLLQMSCTRGGRTCVEVQSGAHKGYIYMSEGRLVHAQVGTRVGEAAVAQMLTWPGGAFALCERPWPLKPSIDASADAVLLRVAQAHDERANDKQEQEQEQSKRRTTASPRRNARMCSPCPPTRSPSRRAAAPCSPKCRGEPLPARVPCWRPSESI